MAKYAALEISEQDVKLLVCNHDRKNGIQIDAAALIDFSDLPRGEESQVDRVNRVREVTKKLKVTSAETAVLIPKQQAILRTASLPSTDPDELEEMSQFEAEKYIPFNSERHIVSSTTVQPDEAGGTLVLITAVDGPVMENALEYSRDLSITPEFAEISSIGLVRAFQEHEAGALEKEAVVLLYIGQNQTEIILFKNGIVMTARSQALGINKLNQDIEKSSHDNETSDEEAQILAAEHIRKWINRIVRFTSQSYDYAAREHGMSSSATLYLCGEGATLQGLSQAISESLGIDTHHFDPMSTYEVSNSDNVDRNSLPGMVGCLGSIIRLIDESENPKNKPARINLLPIEILQRQAAAEKRLIFALSGMMIFITLVLAYLAWDVQAKHNEELAQRYRTYTSDMEPLIDSLGVKKEQLDIINGYTSNQAAALHILDQISTFPGVGNINDNGVLTLTGFRYISGERGEVKFEGVVLNFTDIQRFADFLEKMTDGTQKVFSSVDLPQPKPGELNGESVYQFDLLAYLNDYNSEDEEE